MNKVSFVIPVFRNEGSLTKTFSKINTIFEKEKADYLVEFVFINDGSDDGSLDELKQIKLFNPEKEINIISFSRNFGQIPAINCGLNKASGNAAIVMSADLQDPPKMILKMLKSWKAGNQIVICNRIDRKDNWLSVITSKFFYRLMQLGNTRMPSGGFDFFLLDRKVINEYNQIDERNRFFQGDILWLGFNTQFLPYKREKREIGKSQWSFSKKLKYFIDGLITTSYLPIRFISFFGFLVFLAGILYSLLIVYFKIVNKTPFEGWAPLMIVLLLIGGLNLLTLGIIGEYLWRVYDESRGRKEYIIDQEI